MENWAEKTKLADDEASPESIGKWAGKVASGGDIVFEVHSPSVPGRLCSSSSLPVSLHGDSQKTLEMSDRAVRVMKSLF